MTSEASPPARPREQLMPGFLQRCFRVLQVCFRVLVHPLAVRGSRLFDDVFEGLKV